MTAHDYPGQDAESAMPATGSPAALDHAQALRVAGKFREAEAVYRELLRTHVPREPVLRGLVELYLKTQRLDAAIDTLVALTYEIPDRLYYFARLAALLEGIGRVDEAIQHYLRLLNRRPELPAGHYNLALLYRKQRRLGEAMASYERAVALGIERVEEVYSNMGVLCAELHQKGRAQELYARALAARPDYIPALFNLAGLAEESGDRNQATDLYRKILALQPSHWEALARLVYLQRISDADAGLVESLRQALGAVRDDPEAKEGLYFALGKALDDLGRYDEAFAAFTAGNELGRVRAGAYDPDVVEKAFDQLIATVSRDWIERMKTTCTARPIFICGMPRSGSTLVEQILAAHPLVTAGGELDLLPWLIDQHRPTATQHAGGVTSAGVADLSRRYLDGIKDRFPAATHVTDKRPDNFLHIGLIKAMFPAARIVYTRREALDNCLSIYFQSLGGNLRYATGLVSTAHYYRQHERLMSHWMHCCGSGICTVDYDELVRAPERAVRRLLDFLGLEWDERCLEFHKVGNLVKTASIWQVRDTLYTRSSGRWRHYRKYLEEMRATLDS